jgi:CheY-like chemotaxis protein
VRTALVAEDNAVNRELLRELLEMRGFSVVEARDGEEAIRKIADRLPDILMLDLNMPILDGPQTIERIRQDHSLADLPVLAVTAFAMRGDREKILTSGFNGYISKPISRDALDEELQRIFGYTP